MPVGKNNETYGYIALITQVWIFTQQTDYKIKTTAVNLEKRNAAVLCCPN